MEPISLEVTVHGLPGQWYLTAIEWDATHGPARPRRVSIGSETFTELADAQASASAIQGGGDISAMPGDLFAGGPLALLRPTCRCSEPDVIADNHPTLCRRCAGRVPEVA